MSKTSKTDKQTQYEPSHLSDNKIYYQLSKQQYDTIDNNTKQQNKQKKQNFFNF